MERPLRAVILPLLGLFQPGCQERTVQAVRDDAPRGSLEARGEAAVPPIDARARERAFETATFALG